MCNRISWFFVILVLTLAGSSALAQDQWPYYGGTQWGERHVKFSHIGKHNVAHMVPRRVFQLGEIAYSMTSSPLVIFAYPGSASGPGSMA
jgi:hypothetical protein